MRKLLVLLACALGVLMAGCGQKANPDELAPKDPNAPGARGTGTTTAEAQL